MAAEGNIQNEDIVARRYEVATALEKLSGALIGFIATLSSSGWSGAFLVAFGYIVGLLVLDAFFGWLTAKWSGFLRLSTKAIRRVLACVAALCFCVALVIYWMDESELRYFRKDYCSKNQTIEIDIGSANVSFPDASQSVKQEDEEKHRMLQWVRWMRQGSEKPDSHLYHIRSKPFDDDYLTIHAFLKARSGVKIRNATAFLLHDTAGDRWFMPRWRQVNTVLPRNEQSVTVIVGYPDEGDTLEIFLQVAPDKKGGDLPAPDSLLTKQFMGVSRCD